MKPHDRLFGGWSTWPIGPTCRWWRSAIGGLAGCFFAGAGCFFAGEEVDDFTAAKETNPDVYGPFWREMLAHGVYPSRLRFEARSSRSRTARSISSDSPARPSGRSQLRSSKEIYQSARVRPF